tara:strand:+ start:10477 stop:10683 length:207 start_codon:yes stop_codon:yes gene_type:complete
MKKNVNGIEMDMSAEEIAQLQADQEAIAKEKPIEQKIQEDYDLKASAKAKLVAGEKLTEEEANVLVGV